MDHTECQEESGRSLKFLLSPSLFSSLASLCSKGEGVDVGRGGHREVLLTCLIVGLFV